MYDFNTLTANEYMLSEIIPWHITSTDDDVKNYLLLEIIGKKVQSITSSAAHTKHLCTHTCITDSIKNVWTKKTDNSSVNVLRYAKLSRRNIENPLKTMQCVIWKRLRSHVFHVRNPKSAHAKSLLKVNEWKVFFPFYN